MRGTVVCIQVLGEGPHVYTSFNSTQFHCIKLIISHNRPLSLSSATLRHLKPMNSLSYPVAQSLSRRLLELRIPSSASGNTQIWQTTLNQNRYSESQICCRTAACTSPPSAHRTSQTSVSCEPAIPIHKPAMVIPNMSTDVTIEIYILWPETKAFSAAQ